MSNSFKIKSSKSEKKPKEVKGNDSDFLAGKKTGKQSKKPSFAGKSTKSFSKKKV